MRSRVSPILALVFAIATVGRADESSARPGPRIGISLASAEIVPAIPVPQTGSAVPARLEVSWSKVEAVPGTYDWSAVEAAVDRLGEQGREVSVALGGGHPVHLPAGGRPSPLDGTSIQAWSDFVRSVEVTPRRVFDLVGARWVDLCRLPDKAGGA